MFTYWQTSWLLPNFITNEGAVSIYIQVSGTHKFSPPLGKHHGPWLLNCMVRVYLVLLETTKLSTKVAVPFYIPQAMNDSSCCPTSSPAFGVASDLEFSHHNKCVIWLFNILFSNDTWCRGSLQMIFWHVYIFFVEVSIKICSPFSPLSVSLLLSFK